MYLGASETQLKSLALDLFSKQNSGAPLSVEQFANEIRSLPGQEIGALLMHFEEIGGSVTFSAKVRKALGSTMSPILLCAGSGITGLLIGIVVGRVTKK